MINWFVNSQISEKDLLKIIITKSDMIARLQILNTESKFYCYIVVISHILLPGISCIMTLMYKTHLQHDVASNSSLSICFLNFFCCYLGILFKVFLWCKYGVDDSSILNMSVFQRPCRANAFLKKSTFRMTAGKKY